MGFFLVISVLEIFFTEIHNIPNSCYILNYLLIEYNIGKIKINIFYLSLVNRGKVNLISIHTFLLIQL